MYAVIGLPLWDGATQVIVTEGELAAYVITTGSIFEGMVAINIYKTVEFGLDPNAF